MLSGVLSPAQVCVSAVLVSVTCLFASLLSGCTNQSNTVPFNLDDGYVVVKATLDGHSLSAFVDTGSPEIAVDDSVAATLKLRTKQQTAKMMTPNGIGIVRFLKDPITVQIGDTRLTEQSAGVLNLNYARPNDLVHDDLTIGSRLFDQGVVRIDYSRHLLTVSQKAIGVICKHSLYDTTFTFDGKQRSPVVQVLVDGHPGNVILDTGSSETLWVDPPGLKNFDLFSDALYAEGTPDHRAPVNTITFGPINLSPNVRFEFQPFPPNLDGRMGSKVFIDQSLSLVLDYKSKTMCVLRDTWWQ